MRPVAREPHAMEVESLVEELTREGAFGEGAFIEVIQDNKSKVGAQFASCILRLVLRLKSNSGDTRELRLVVKTQLKDPREREMRDTDVQFANEVAMYEDLLPFLDTDHSRPYPKMYHGNATSGSCPAEDIIILEDLSPNGYKISQPKLFLDFQHVALAMKRIGEFHSWSYRIKKLHKNQLLEKITKLKIPVFKSQPGFDSDDLLPISLIRGIKPFLDKNIETESLQKFLGLFKNMKLLFFLFFKPDEPFAVLCHGDFCKNNLFYKYDTKGLPIDSAFFDFQTSKYSSPAIDLSFFLYMHTTSELRDQHWDDFLQIYWKSVEEGAKDVDLPTYKEFLSEFSSRAVYAYFHCSFFAPIMLLNEPFGMNVLMEMPKEKQIEFFQNVAGDEGLKVITSIIQHFIDNNYINQFIEYYEKNAPAALEFLEKF